MTLTADQIATHGLSPEEYQKILGLIGREPNLTELGIFSVMWSEHCSYKSSRIHLKQFPTNGPQVIQGPGENAGIVDIGGDLAIAFKMESHNHPSYIEPYQGAATGVGGILRDVFTMGARPIANLNSLRFGEPAHAKTPHLVRGVVAGIGGYGNCLSGSERICVINDAEVHDVAIGSYCDNLTNINSASWTMESPKPIRILSYDPIKRKSCWQPVRKIIKRKCRELVCLHMDLGRKFSVTPDHPVVIEREGVLHTMPAVHVKRDDRIPLLKKFPLPLRNIKTIDLVEQLKNKLSGLYIAIKGNSSKIRISSHLVSSAWQRHEYRKKRSMPLDLFMQLEKKCDLNRDGALLYLPSGKANFIPVKLKVDENLARLMGYYLSEGTISRNGTTYKIIWTFGLHENDYAEDVCGILKEMKVRYSREVRKSTIAILVSSILLGTLFKEIWQVGGRSYEKRIPDLFMRHTRRVREHLLRGIFRGDSGITFKNKGSRAKICYASTSSELFHQVLLLLQDQGVFPYILLRNQPSCIQGRHVKAKPLHTMEISNYHDIRLLQGLYPLRIRKKINHALSQYLYQGKKYSYPRKIDCGPYITVGVNKIETKKCEESVYDFEVEGTHLFTTTNGVITHNCMGIPTVAGEVYFDGCYDGNILVNAMTVGLVRKDEIFLGFASGVGNPVIYVGSKTGRDGIHGATMASDVFDETSEEKRPTVQVGDPFTEKLLLEACLEAMKTGVIVGIQDMGAAGLTSSSFEMASRAGTGIRMNLDQVPCRETGMTAYDILLSESQERMLMVVKQGEEDKILKIFEKWELDACIVGEVTNDGHMRIVHHGEEVVILPIAPLAHAAPLYDRPRAKPKTQDALNAAPPVEKSYASSNWNELLLKMMGSPNLCSRQWIYQQYDQSVGDDTVVLPGSDAAVVRIKDTGKAVATAVDCNSRYCYLDPYWGGAHAIAECARNISCSGATPLAATDCLNFGNPERPEVMWQFERACSGMSEACRVLNTPIVSGNVSLYNESIIGAGKAPSTGKAGGASPSPAPCAYEQPTSAIYPTPTIGMVGLLSDVRHHATSHFQQAGDAILILGGGELSLGGSEFAWVMERRVAGRPPALDLLREKNTQTLLRQWIVDGKIRSAHDVSDGGLAVALAECSFKNGLGAQVTVQGYNDPLMALFGEGGSRIIITCTVDQAAELCVAATQAGVPIHDVGTVGGDDVCVNKWLKAPVAELKKQWQTGFEAIVGKD